MIEEGSIGGSNTYFVGSQYFKNGNEDLNIDITNIISASMVGLLPDHGFLLSFSGSEEHDSKSRFVKRFASRHSRNIYKRPKLIIHYDDSIIDNHNNMEFNVTGSLFLKSYSRGSLLNIISGSGNSEVSGDNCVLVKVHTGSYQKFFTGSQHSISGINKEGIYKTNVNIDRYLSASVTSDATLNDFVVNSGSVTFGQEWLSLDSTISYFTGSLTIKKLDINTKTINKKLNFKITNLRQEYRDSDIPKLDIFVSDISIENKSVRIPSKLSSLVLGEVYYRIRDTYNGKILTPFIAINIINGHLNSLVLIVVQMVMLILLSPLD